MFDSGIGCGGLVTSGKWPEPWVRATEGTMTLVGGADLSDHSPPECSTMILCGILVSGR